jgi:hypothetical protein
MTEGRMKKEEGRRRKKSWRIRHGQDLGLTADTHLHVILVSPDGSSRVVFIKGDHDKRIDELMQAGWEQVERPD